jgi:iron(III) transport system ATP-binding protein
MRDGHVEQVGAPEDLYAHPRTRWVAEFLGDAEILAGTVDGGVVECELGRFPAPSSTWGIVDVVVRPETIALTRVNGHGAPDGIAARVVGGTFYGHDQVILLELASGRRLRSRHVGTERWRPGDDVRVRIQGPVTTVSAGIGAAGTGGEEPT